MNCDNCGCSIDVFRGNYVSDPLRSDFTGRWNKHFCSVRCQREYHSQDEFVIQQQEAERKRQLEEQRRIAEEQRRIAEEQRRRQEEKIRLEKLGKCEWCGKQNEVVYANQLLFPGKKFCSKKCLFDCKSAENPTEVADNNSFITVQSTGSICTSVEDAIEYAADGDTLLFSKGEFDLKYVIVNKSLTLKTAHNDTDVSDEEKSVINLKNGNLSLYVQSAGVRILIDGITFNAGNAMNYSSNIHIDVAPNSDYSGGNCISVLNAEFLNFYVVFWGFVDGLTVKNCRFTDCKIIFNQESVVEDVSVMKCTFENVEAVFYPCQSNCTLEENIFTNAFLNPFYTASANEPKTVNERTGKNYDCLQQAIDESNTGDTLILSPGVYANCFAIAQKQNLTLKGVQDNGRAIFNVNDVQGQFLGFYGGQLSGITIEGVYFNFVHEYGHTPVQKSSWSLQPESVTFASCEFNNIKKDDSNFGEYFVFKKCKFNKFAVRTIVNICQKCGAALYKGKKFCTQCGAKIEENSKER